jgi:hypothetical protein
MNMSTEYNDLPYIMSQSTESEHPRTNWPDRLHGKKTSYTSVTQENIIQFSSPRYKCNTHT